MRFNKSFALIITISLLAGAAGASVSSERSSLKMRQPIKVAAMTKRGDGAIIQQKINSATASAERLDQRIPDILQATSGNILQRLKAGVVLRQIENQYAQDLAAHIAAMTEVLRTRRGLRGFIKWQEFEFKNLLVKSDYLLAVPMTRQSLSAQRNSLEVQKMLLEYNRERLYFDGRKITL